MIPLRNRLNDLLGFRGVERYSLVQLLLGCTRLMCVQMATTFTAKLEFARSSHLEAAFARLVCFHLRHSVPAHQKGRLRSRAGVVCKARIRMRGWQGFLLFYSVKWSIEAILVYS